MSTVAREILYDLRSGVISQPLKLESLTSRRIRNPILVFFMKDWKNNSYGCKSLDKKLKDGNTKEV